MSSACSDRKDAGKTVPEQPFQLQSFHTSLSLSLSGALAVGWQEYHCVPHPPKQRHVINFCFWNELVLSLTVNFSIATTMLLENKCQK